MIHVKPLVSGTASMQGDLWSARPRDWADVQEDTMLPLYQAVLERAGLAGGARWLEELPWADASFDVVTGFNAFQYAAHPVKALREARRVAVPGAEVFIATWGAAQDCEAAGYLRALGALSPPPPPGAPGPFALSEPGALERLAVAAGLTPGEHLEVECTWYYAEIDTALRGLLSAGPAVRAVRHSGEERVRRAVTAAITPFRTARGGYRIENTFRCLVAR